MDKLLVHGPCKLNGTVKISRAKNAYLPILAAVLLSDKKIHLKNIPDLQDIKTMIKLLEMLGVTVTRAGNITTFDASTLNSHEATYDLVKTMRASIFVLGPLLARLGKAKVSLPGGCAIGTRPIDIHLTNLEKMGCEIHLTGGYVEASVSKLKATHLPLSFPSVGATENLMMAAVFVEGTTVIDNAALEPEIDDLANFINAMGGKVTGIGTRKLEVTGVKELSDVRIEDVNPSHLEFVIELLKEMGGKISVGDNFIHVEKSVLKSCHVDTAPFPGFPTDAQAQMIALCTQVKGSSVITEHIFENRFMHVPELVRLGANIVLKGKSAIIEGEQKLNGAPIMCTDLRASAALIIAALCATGTTEIQRIYHLDRGYEKLVDKLATLGAKVERVK
ncbi:MAG: UDP-N-acetylglucosamine 1-carboxyvinyltransferase [Bacteriovoracaceae bacterium]|nr:UDP-N-acetylglucosamine 1-carboxyvinyltransferase [Bacteriovoracaceae bacterium]